MPSGVYNSANHLLARARLNLESDELTLLLLDADYVPDFSAHATLEDVELYEVAGAGYARKALGGQRLERDDGNNAIALHADGVVWPESTISAQYYVIARGTDLIGCVDFERVRSSDGGDFAILWHADGVLLLNGKKD